MKDLDHNAVLYVDLMKAEWKISGYRKAGNTQGDNGEKRGGRIPPPALGFVNFTAYALGVRPAHVNRLRPLVPARRLERDLRALGQGLETRALDVSVVDKQVLPTVVWGDEAEPLCVVEPLHGSVAHAGTPSLFGIGFEDSETTWESSAAREGEKLEGLLGLAEGNEFQRCSLFGANLNHQPLDDDTIPPFFSLSRDDGK